MELTVTRTEYDDIKRRIARYNKRRGNRTSVTVKEIESWPANAQATNAERSQVEVYDFVNDPPDKYFLYISRNSGLATTWTGDKLGDVFFGMPFRDNFGGERVPVRILAITGEWYHGHYMKSSGDYARISKSKSAPRVVNELIVDSSGRYYRKDRFGVDGKPHEHMRIG